MRAIYINANNISKYNSYTWKHVCSLFDDEAKLLPIENNKFLSQKSKFNPTLKYYQIKTK